MLCVVLDATRSNPLLHAVTDSNIAAAGRATLQTVREGKTTGAIESSGKHNIEMPESRVVRRALIALTESGTHYPEGSLLMDFQTIPFENVEVLAHCPFAIWVNLRMLLSTRFFGGFTIPWGP